MIQCSNCEFYNESPAGAEFTCDPFSTIKEPECLVKWQLIKLETMVQAYQQTVRMYQRMAPLQEKMLRQMERELDDQNEADAWKLGYDDEPDTDPEDDEPDSYR
jgi:hypothetical protein